MRIDIICLYFSFFGITESNNNKGNFLQLLTNVSSNILHHISQDPEVDMTVPEIIRYHGYPVEIHAVTTNDGYILTMHRIPHGKRGSGQLRQPVLLQHGLQSSSSQWVCNPPDKNLAYILANNGFDVWLGNIRGNKYSKNHTTLSTRSSKYWDFSLDEMAKYDLPAMIDYVLRKTGYSRLLYVGHSMGNTLMFAMLSTFPEYNQKVKGFCALAPIVHIGKMKSAGRFLLQLITLGGSFFRAINHGEFKSATGPLQQLMAAACGIDTLKILLCIPVFFLQSGPDYAQLNQSRVSVYLNLIPDVTSVRTVQQFGQMMLTNRFRFFDFGTKKNLVKYNQATPPEYDLTKISAPVALFWGENDWLAVPDDIAKIPPKLKNLTLNYKVNYPLFNHADFIVALDVVPLLYNQVEAELIHF